MNSVLQIYRMIGRTFGSVLVPVVLFAAGLLMLFNLVSLPGFLAPFLHAIPYVTLGAAAGLGWWFHRSTVVFSALLLTGVHWFLLTYFDGGTPGPNAIGQVTYAGIAVLLPINFIAISLMEERGLLTEIGLGRLAVFLLQLLILAALTATGVWLDAGTGAMLQQTASQWLHWRIFPKEYDYWTYLPQPAMHLFVIALIVLGTQLWRNLRSAMEAGMLGSFLAASLALHLVGDSAATSVFMGVAGLSLLLTMGQDTYRMAFVDELTNLPSRRALQTMMLKLGRRYVIAMLDVDHFKSFNDTHGHDVGDQVLRMVAARLDAVRGGGRAFRYGGEEFTVVFRGKDLDAAMPYLEELRLAVEKSSFSLRGGDRPEEVPDRPKKKPVENDRVSVTISIGAATPSGSGMTPEEVIKAADDALYRAKRSGRNRVSL